jgi:hypothetical protein
MIENRTSPLLLSGEGPGGEVKGDRRRRLKKAIEEGDRRRR